MTIRHIFARLKAMKTLYDVQQLLKHYGVVVYVGKRLYDIELMKLELKSLYDAGILDKQRYLLGAGILQREHDLEVEREKK